MKKENEFSGKQLFWTSNGEIMRRYAHLFPQMSSEFFQPILLRANDSSWQIFPTSYHQLDSVRLKRWREGIDTTVSDRQPLVQIKKEGQAEFQTAICFGARGHEYIKIAFEKKTASTPFKADTNLNAVLVSNLDGTLGLETFHLDAWAHTIIMGCQVLASIPAQYRSDVFNVKIGSDNADLIVDLMSFTVTLCPEESVNAVEFKQECEDFFKVNIPEIKQRPYQVPDEKDVTFWHWIPVSVVVPHLLSRLNF